MEKVLIAGGTGLLGQELSALLKDQSYEVRYLSRRREESPDYFYWSPDDGKLDKESLSWADYIVYLNGTGIADKRWTSERKKLILSSRVNGLELLQKHLAPHNINSIVSASGVGYYGATTSDHIFKEEDPPGDDFLADTCLKWEAAAKNLEEFAPVTVLRFGIILSNKGGALPRMAQPVSLGLGAPLASGRQYVPWIHIHDAARMILYSIKERKSTVYNAVAPSYITNQTLNTEIAAVLNKPLFMPALPAFVLKIALGEMSIMLTEGSRVSCEKIEKSGFSFTFSTLSEALKNLYINQ